jgi:hypothetical protein
VQTEHGTLSANFVEEEVRLHGFDVVSRDDLFINRPIRGAWWLIIARKP